MDAALTAAVVGAMAGVVTGLGTALVTLRGVRLQANAALELQREQWHVENLRAAYGVLLASFRQLMMAWWALRRRRDEGVESCAPLYEQVVVSFTGFSSACVAVSLLIPASMVSELDKLRDAMRAFDKAAETMDFVRRVQWSQADDEAYDRIRRAAEAQHDAFILAARDALPWQPAARRPTGRP